MNRILSILSASIMFAVSFGIVNIASAQDTPPSPHIAIIEELFSKSAPECVPVKDFESAGIIKMLSNDQFEFIRGMYFAIPPRSDILPPGDHAILAQIDGLHFVALVADNQTCARFIIPPIIEKIILSIQSIEI